MRTRLWSIFGAYAVLQSCTSALDFDATSTRHWAVEGAPVGALRLGFADKCVAASSSEARAGAVIEVRACDDPNAQAWTVGHDDSLQVLGQCLEVSDSPSDRSRVQLSECTGSATQAWIDLTGELFNVGVGRCLEVKDESAGDGTPLQIGTCSGDTNQRWVLPTGRKRPDRFGPNVFVFDPSMPEAAIAHRVKAVFGRQEQNQFGWERYALLFKPGTYDVDVNVGFYTQVAGLGYLPDDVTIRGAVHTEGDWWPDASNKNNSTQNFWRSAENLSVVPRSGWDRWAVSQAAPYRRMHLRGHLRLDDEGGWSSGGFMADTQIDGDVWSGSQQQWFARNSAWRSWGKRQGELERCNWNMVFVGDLHAPTSAPCTTLEDTPSIREKPFLYVDQDDEYRVFVPELRSDTRGTSWSNGNPLGKSLSLEDFAIIKIGDTADTMNAALAEGKNLLITPANYKIDKPIEITRDDTVVLGLGVASLVSDSGNKVISIAGAQGVIVAGLLIDAGPMDTALLMEVGDLSESKLNRAENPTSLHDLYFRIGGRPQKGRARVSLQINSANVLGDHLWLWRADHSKENADSAGWTKNPADTGLIVRGDDVTIYGLFVEHYQNYQTHWFGERGRTYFYMSETPYDVPLQESWLNGSQPGYAMYKLDDSVTEHRAWGLGAYCFFRDNPSVVLSHAFEVPKGVGGISLQNMLTVSLRGEIQHVWNDTGSAVNGANFQSRSSYP